MKRKPLRRTTARSSEATVLTQRSTFRNGRYKTRSRMDPRRYDDIALARCRKPRSARHHITSTSNSDQDDFVFDGKPRPINISHGESGSKAGSPRAGRQKQLINRARKQAGEDGRRITGCTNLVHLKPLEDIGLSPVPHHTEGGVNVINSGEGLGS